MGGIWGGAPRPSGMEFLTDTQNPNIQMEITGSFARRRRRVSGYAGDNQMDTEANGTSAPAQMRVVAIPPGVSGPPW